MSAPNYPLRLDPLRRARWKFVAESEGMTLAGWIKSTCDKASKRYIMHGQDNDQDTRYKP